jgi:hypothetical protein
MEVIEIYFGTIRGTATLIESSALYGLWKIGGRQVFTNKG